MNQKLNEKKFKLLKKGLTDEQVALESIKHYWNINDYEETINSYGDMEFHATAKVRIKNGMTIPVERIMIIPKDKINAKALYNMRINIMNQIIRDSVDTILHWDEMPVTKTLYK